MIEDSSKYAHDRLHKIAQGASDNQPRQFFGYNQASPEASQAGQRFMLNVQANGLHPVADIEELVRGLVSGVPDNEIDSYIQYGQTNGIYLMLAIIARDADGIQGP